MNLTATPLRSLANSLRLHYDSKNRSQIFQHVENFSAVGEAVATPLRMSATDSEVNATVLRLQIVQFAMESQSNSQKCKRGFTPVIIEIFKGCVHSSLAALHLRTDFSFRVAFFT